MTGIRRTALLTHPLHAAPERVEAYRVELPPGSGAAKAIADAFALENACGAASELAPALSGYERARHAAGLALVTLGSSLGRAQVGHTPDWSQLSAADFLLWWQEAASGRSSLYE